MESGLGPFSKPKGDRKKSSEIKADGINGRHSQRRAEFVERDQCLWDKDVGGQLGLNTSSFSSVVANLLALLVLNSCLAMPQLESVTTPNTNR